MTTTAVIAAAGVGGGSLVYGGVMVLPPKWLFEKVMPDAISYDEMAADHYKRPIEMMNATTIPDDVIAAKEYLGMRVFMKQAEEANYPLRCVHIPKTIDNERTGFGARRGAPISI